jgi:predicted PurR-regulated permease PerM
MRQQTPLIVRLTAALLFIILFFYGLIAAKDILVPLALGTLFAFLLYPIASFLEKSGITRILANLLAIILGIVIVSGAVYLIYWQLSIFVSDFPELRQKSLTNLRGLTHWVEANVGISAAQQQQGLRDFITDAFIQGGETFRGVFTATTTTVAKIGLLPVFVFFLLYYRNKFKAFILKLTDESKHEKTGKVIKEISHVTQRYMSGITTVVLILCFLNTFGLMIVGLKYTLLLGILSALMNYIPYFGTILGGAIPFTVALITEDSPSYAFGVIILFIIIQFTENNILTPNIVGGNVRINPFFVILSIIIGGLVWGIAGMFIVLPFIAMFKIVCENIEALHPYAFLLGTEGTEKHALTWEKIKAFFRSISIKNK